ncbi:hypothetical protein PCL_01173 [Purpureocillium lilacinum]|uniref:Uncharacterized protein n=1 Tax=Purpureocillium lilacinum TaxID=33203 RepID=A0A2U3E4X1_PURLI|nr:hypothetical protein PCL_01173 [Purpureocillium lilacinum]
MSVSEIRAGYPAACVLDTNTSHSRSHARQLAQRRDPWAPVPGFRISAPPRSPTSRAACLSLASQWVAADAALPLEARRVLSHIIQRREADAASRRRSRTAKPDGRRLTKLWKKQWIPALMPRVLTGVPDCRLQDVVVRGPRRGMQEAGWADSRGGKRPSQGNESLKIPARPSAASLTDSAAVHSPRTERSPPPCGGRLRRLHEGPSQFHSSLYTQNQRVAHSAAACKTAAPGAGPAGCSSRNRTNNGKRYNGGGGRRARWDRALTAAASEPEIKSPRRALASASHIARACIERVCSGWTDHGMSPPRPPALPFSAGRAGPSTARALSPPAPSQIGPGSPTTNQQPPCCTRAILWCSAPSVHVHVQPTRLSGPSNPPSDLPQSPRPPPRSASPLGGAAPSHTPVGSILGCQAARPGLTWLRSWRDEREKKLEAAATEILVLHRRPAEPASPSARDARLPARQQHPPPPPPPPRPFLSQPAPPGAGLVLRFSQHRSLALYESDLYDVDDTNDDDTNDDVIPAAAAEQDTQGRRS